MGFFSSVSKGVNKFVKGTGEALFGTETAKDAARSAEAAQKTMGGVGTKAGGIADKYGAQAATYDKQTAGNLGTSAADYMAEQQAAAEQGAEKQGLTAATQGTQAALRSARSSGLSKGQAALVGAQQAGDIYTNAYGTGLESGKQNYAQGTQMQAAQGAEMANRQQNAMNTQLGAATGQANVAQNQTQNAANKSAQTWGTIGTVAGAGALMLSDENTKTNVLDSSKSAVKDQANAASEAAKKSFDSSGMKENLSKALAGMGSMSQRTSAAPVTTGSVNAAQDTTAAGNAAANQGLMNVAAGVKSMMDKSKAAKGLSGDMGSIASSGSMGSTGMAGGLPGAGAATGAAGAGASAGGLGAMLSKAAPMLSALSDENTKTDVKEIKDRLSKIDVREIAKKIRPVSFEYKPGAEAIDPKAKPDVEHVGVIAQDLEKTALAPAVKTGDDGIKRIDIAELAPALLNMIVQQQAQIDRLSKGAK